MPKFVPRERKRKVLDRQKDARTTVAAQDSTAIELPVVARADQDERKKRLREQLQAGQPKHSSKKQKRLEKYIDTKLRKEDTLSLIKRLEEKHKSVDRSLLQSAKTLGRQGETKRETFQRALREKEKGVRVREADAILFERPGKRKAEHVEEGDGAESDDATPDDQRKVAESAIVRPLSVQTPAVNFGSGLKQPFPLDEDGKPILKRRKRARTGPKNFDVLRPPQQEEQTEWKGFSDGEVEQDEMSELSRLEDDLSEPDMAEVVSSGGEEEQHEESDSEGEERSDDSSSDGDSETSETEEEDDDGDRQGRKARTSAFKAWAEQQRNDTVGFQPSTVTGSSTMVLPETSDAIKKSFVPRPAEAEPLPEGFHQQTAALEKRKAHAVDVRRSEVIQATRLALPVLAEESRIMEAIFNNDVVIVSGATGSGKTTQVPQFLFEYGFGDPKGPTPGMIGITQPRRVAAVSMANRVSEELGESGKRVAHQIRFDSTVSRDTAIKFMTDGVLLREISEDFTLRKYSAIVIDEAHERTVNTDILISLMSRCIPTRRDLAKKMPHEFKPLKLIIMSATLRVEDFKNNSRLFPISPPLVEAEGRQYDVTVHWSRRTTHDYVEEAFAKVSRGHRKLPPGGILVFLTGQNEIRQLMRRLKDVFHATDKRGADHPKMRINAGEMMVEAEDMEEMSVENRQDYIEEDIEDDSSDINGGVEDPDAEFVIEGEEAPSEIAQVHVLPLYSQLPSKEQLKIFEAPPEDSRMIVLATNVAETSLTIPGIRYVFDCGRHKERTWDRAGVQTFRTSWVSKASADQRMGRAGRTGPGHCYRLYSSAMYESAMPQFSQPEIFRSPLEGVVLQLKSLTIDRVENFPFPTPPERGNIIKAERLLKNLGALDPKGHITSLGRELQKYPLNPRFAQMLRLGIMYDCVREIIATVAALDVPELIIPEHQLDLKTPTKAEDEEWTAEDDIAESAREVRRKAYNSAQAKLSRLDFNKAKLTPQADALKLFAAMVDYSTVANDASATEDFCKDNFLREKGMREASQLREQLTAIINHVSPEKATSTYIPALPQKSSDKTIALIKQILAAGFCDQIALRADLLPSPPVEERKPKRAIDVKYKTLFSSTGGDTGVDDDDDDDPFVYIHPSSLLSRLPPSSTPRYIIYQRLQRSQPSRPGAKAKVRMHALTSISAAQIASITRNTGLLEVGKPIGKIEVLAKSGKGEERRECEVMLSLVGDEKGLGWPLVRKRVVQKRVAGEGWVVEKWMD